jgi:protein-tyrosine phosphatase
MIDLSWITPELAIGGCFAPEHCEQLAREQRVRGVVDLRAEACDQKLELSRHGIELLHLPTRDHCAIAPDMLRAGVAFADRHLRAKGRVLLHCQHGIGRSALLALCVLVDHGYQPLAALALAKARREQVSPSPAQYAAWSAWLAERGESAPSFEEFAAIAYRHLRR